MDLDVGDLFSDVNEGMTEIKDSLSSSVDVSDLTKGKEVAQEFYNSVLSGKQCSEDDAQCIPGDKVITDSGNKGVVIDETMMDPGFKQQIDNREQNRTSPERRKYVLFQATDLPEKYKTEDYESYRNGGVYVFVYEKGQLKKRESREKRKEKAKEFLITKIGESVGDGGTDETATSDSGAGETSP